MGERRVAYRALVGRPERRNPLGRPKRRWEDNSKVDLQDVGWGVDWIGRWQALVNAVFLVWLRTC
jgi:hypothetical protein